MPRRSCLLVATAFVVAAGPVAEAPRPPPTRTLEFLVAEEIDGAIIQVLTEFVDTNGSELKGIPGMAYRSAYLLSAPFQRTNCVPLEGDCDD